MASTPHQIGVSVVIYGEMLATALLACGAPGVNSAVTGGSSGGFGLPIGFGDVITSWIAFSIVALGVLTLVLTVFLLRRGGPAPAAVPIGATLSPDGAYWWDGASWRPAR
ncbi:MAG TPA: hypothetical protein VI384_03255 [Candidatus Dormibacteraeota bacterium]